MATCQDVDNADDYENSELYGEIELLKEIYISELSLVQEDENVRPECITLVLHPATGDNDEEKFVCLTLDLKTPSDYPEAPPDIVIRNTRGLADEHIASIRKELHIIANERIGGPMLYELIELVKDNLTFGNIPYGSCVICLENFEEGDSFRKTDCYHYFHSNCLLRYVEHSLLEIEEYQKQMVRHIEQEEKQVVCPVCRVPITFDLESLKQNSASVVDDTVYKPSPEIVQLQKKMSALYLKQKKKGGIIDVEAESKKYLVSLRTENQDNAEDSSEPQPSGDDAVEVPEPVTSVIPGLGGRGRGKRPGWGERHERSRDYRHDRRDHRPIPKPRGGFRPRREERSTNHSSPTEPNTSKQRNSPRDEISSQSSSHTETVNPRKTNRNTDRDLNSRRDTHQKTENRDKRNRSFVQSNGASEGLSTDKSTAQKPENTSIAEQESPRDREDEGAHSRGRGRGSGRSRGRGRGLRGRRPPPGYSDRGPPGFGDRRKEDRQRSPRAPPGFGERSANSSSTS